MSEPSSNGVSIIKNVNDSRWKGWQKWAANINGIEIHYVYNPITGQFDDFKFAG